MGILTQCVRKYTAVHRAACSYAGPQRFSAISQAMEIYATCARMWIFVAHAIDSILVYYML